MIHKEGYPTLLLSFVILNALCIAVSKFFPSISIAAIALSIGLFAFLVSFFRNPSRPIPKHDGNLVYAPADGKVVVIEKTNEAAYLNKEAIQVSVFMSPLNVHVNRHPIDAEVEYSEHHNGKFLPAWDPKSSVENERTTVAYKTPHGVIVMRQVAGALAKRIINYTKKGDKALQGQEMGFIKFGSRVDLYLPLNAEILVKIGDVVEGNTTVLARFK
jgi:phosphatidylserine decarboxylase